MIAFFSTMPISRMIPINATSDSSMWQISKRHANAPTPPTAAGKNRDRWM